VSPETPAANPATAAGSLPGPVVVDAAPTPATRAPNIAVVLVTWNRKDMIARVLEDLAKQTFPVDRFDVVVCDNASTDGTLEHLRERFTPERIVENPAENAHQPAFGATETTGGPNSLGFRSLTIVRNTANFGGCGGFNTDFAFVEQVLDHTDSGTRPDYMWLVDDDVRMPPETCERLVKTAEGDPGVGLVGTRTVHIDSPEETIETTIYFNPATGLMDDHPPAGHRLEASHREWAAAVGGPKGTHEYTGLREVDVVSACSMLARWSAVREVGFWDWRYFIYCDDADWCMRFAKAGHKVVLNLDATVLHTPWHYKLTPARLYYAQRNVIWMMEKVLPARELRRVVARRMGTLLRDSMYAMLMRRQFHAEIIRRTAKDVCVGTTGKLDFEGPAAQDLGPALVDAGLLTAETRIAMLCSNPRSLEWSTRVRAAVRVHAARRDSPVPTFVEIVRNDVPGAEAEPPPGVERVLYSSRNRSKARRLAGLIGARPDAALVFEQVNDFPLCFGRWNIHIDPKSLGRCQVERDTLGSRLLFLGGWLRTCARCATYVLRLGSSRSEEKYGGFPQGKASA
jgi:GT2 family glycosyltransferase